MTFYGQKKISNGRKGYKAISHKSSGQHALLTLVLLCPFTSTIAQGSTKRHSCRSGLSYIDSSLSPQQQSFALLVIQFRQTYNQVTSLFSPMSPDISYSLQFCKTVLLFSGQSVILLLIVFNSAQH